MNAAYIEIRDGRLSLYPTAHFHPLMADHVAKVKGKQ